MGFVTPLPSGPAYNSRSAPGSNSTANSHSALSKLAERISTPWMRTTLSVFFMLAMLASAHLSMTVVNFVEKRVDNPQPAAGQPARMFTDSPMLAELQGALKKARTAEDKAVLTAAIADAQAGKTIPLRTMPVTPSLVVASLLMTFIGGLLLLVTTRLTSDAGQTILGIFAGNMLWTGGVEYGLTMAGRWLGVAKTVAVVDGQLTGIYGEYVLLKHTWGIFVLIGAYFMFLESSRCPLTLWWRDLFPMKKGNGPSGRIDNYGPRSAFQYATTTWAFYLLLLWAYDESVFGVHGLFTNSVMFASLAGSGYLLYRLHQHHGWGPAVRYAVGAVIVAWTPLEIAGKWNLFTAPWLILQSSSFIVFFGGLTLGTVLLWRASKRKLVIAPPA